MNTIRLDCLDRNCCGTEHDEQAESARKTEGYDNEGHKRWTTFQPTSCSIHLTQSNGEIGIENT